MRSVSTTVNLDGIPGSMKAADPAAPAASVSDGWLEAVDLLAFDGLPQETPEIAGLFYPGRRILVSGPSESAKTWAGMAAAVFEISAGRDVLWIDTDGMGERSILERLRVLNADDDAIRAHFHYRWPSGRLSSEAQKALISSLDGRLVVCDSFNATMTLHGLDPNKGPEVEAFYQRIVDPFCGAGFAFVLLDHVAKAARANTPYAIGSERKHSGAYLHLGFEVIGDQYVTRDGVGRSRIRMKKDRGAYFDRPEAGTFRLEIVAGVGNWRLEPPRHDASWKPATLMEHVSIFVEQCDDPPYKKNIEDARLGKAAYVRDALARLVKDKYLREVPGKRKDTVRYVSDRPYRESEDEVVPKSSQVVPNEHGRLPEQVVPSSPSKGTSWTTANPDPEASRPSKSSQVDPLDEPPADPRAHR
jgi:hypothetical protein